MGISSMRQRGAAQCRRRHEQRAALRVAAVAAVAQADASALEPDWGGPGKAARVVADTACVAGNGFRNGDRLLDLIGGSLPIGAPRSSLAPSPSDPLVTGVTVHDQHRPLCERIVAS
jgi:hypothetical protein